MAGSVRRTSVVGGGLHLRPEQVGHPQDGATQAHRHGPTVAQFDGDLAEDLAHRATQGHALHSGVVADEVGDDVQGPGFLVLAVADLAKRS
jgi:hypothetical protein